MGNSINTRNTVANMADMARIQNVENHRDDAQKSQSTIILKKEASIKEEQVQTSNKTEHTEIDTKHEINKENKKKKGKPKKPYIDPKIISDENENLNKQNHIDLKI